MPKNKFEARDYIGIYIPEAFRHIDKEFQDICNRYGVNQSEIIRKAIEFYVVSMKRNGYEPFDYIK